MKIPINREPFTLSSGTMSGVHFGHKTNPIKVVFLHANGMNALCYRSLLEPLGVHCLALDLRGHGFTKLPVDSERLSNFHVFANDVCEVLDQLSGGPVILSGHSLGASTALLVAKLRPEKAAGIMAFDPVLLPPFSRFMMRFKVARNYLGNRLPMAARAGRKRAEFETKADALTHYEKRGLFKALPLDTVKDYLEGGLIDLPNGGVRLACEPLWERAVYMGQSHNLVPAIKSLKGNNHIITSDFYGNGKRVERLMGKHAKFHWVDRPDFDHFFPLTQLEFSTDYFNAMIKTTSLN